MIPSTGGPRLYGSVPINKNSMYFLTAIWFSIYNLKHSKIITRNSSSIFTLFVLSIGMYSQCLESHRWFYILSKWTKLWWFDDENDPSRGGPSIISLLHFQIIGRRHWAELARGAVGTWPFWSLFCILSSVSVLTLLGCRWSWDRLDHVLALCSD